MISFVKEPTEVVDVPLRVLGPLLLNLRVPVAVWSVRPLNGESEIDVVDRVIRGPRIVTPNHAHLPPEDSPTLLEHRISGCCAQDLGPAVLQIRAEGVERRAPLSVPDVVAPLPLAHPGVEAWLGISISVLKSLSCRDE